MAIWMDPQVRSQYGDASVPIHGASRPQNRLLAGLTAADLDHDGLVTVGECSLVEGTASRANAATYAERAIVLSPT